MTIGALELEHLPRQKALVESAYDAFYSEKDVVAAVLLGSLSSGKGVFIVFIVTFVLLCLVDFILV